MLTCPILWFVFCRLSQLLVAQNSVYFLLLSNPDTEAAARVKILPLQTEARCLCYPSTVPPSAYVDWLACPVFYPLLSLPSCVNKALTAYMGKECLFFSTWQIRVGSSVETKLQNDFSAPSPTGPPTQLLKPASVGRLYAKQVDF